MTWQMKIALDADAVYKSLEAYADKLAPAVAEGLQYIAQNIMDKSQDLVPVDTGALRASGYVDFAKTEDRRVSVELGYGGPAGGGTHLSGGTNAVDVGYAEVQHERLDFNHTVGQAKYLEQPMAQAIPTMADDLSAFLGSTLHAS